LAKKGPDVARSTVNTLLREEKLPAVAIDETGMFFFINEAFEKEYGWSQEELIGSSITNIMPAYMRDMHNFGFARFVTTGVSKIQGRPLALPILCKSGEIKDAVHFIVSDQKQGKWRFAATIKPRKPATKLSNA
jgi:PAS domain S-box-containing protein